MKVIRAINVVNIINEILTIPIILSLSKAPIRGLIRPKRTISVKRTAICAGIFASFFTPEFIANNISPIKTGINAVTDGVLDVKYAQVPNPIKVKAFSKLA
ncbi:hypothetical protein [Tenacibaculum sp. nBUS_03]|uniref:hypothetical protein n=1 Tax=Tenacibaculum sp. nBUS_03 TaxID=3395320 RepID=UPI003EB74CA6